MLPSCDGDIITAAAAVGVRPDEILDFSGNVAPVEIPDEVRQAVQLSSAVLHLYPDPSARAVRDAAAQAFNADPDQILVGCDSAEFIYALPRALRPRRAVILAPCSHDYWRAAEQAGAEGEGVLATEEHELLPDLNRLEMYLSGADMAFIGNPNNPTGAAIPGESIRVLAGRFPGVTFVVDESYVEFVPESQGISLMGLQRTGNIVILRSLSPLWGLAGLRVGFMVGTTELCRTVDRARVPWSVNLPALMASEALLRGPRDPARQRELVLAERERLRDTLSRMAGIRVYRSLANFLLVKVTRPGLTSATLCERLLRQRILVRNAASFRGLDGRFLRLSVRPSGDNDRLIEAMKAALDEAHWR